jgi:hypothetical protein
VAITKTTEVEEHSKYDVDRVVTSFASDPLPLPQPTADASQSPRFVPPSPESTIDTIAAVIGSLENRYNLPPAPGVASAGVADDALPSAEAAATVAKIRAEADAISAAAAKTRAEADTLLRAAEAAANRTTAEAKRILAEADHIRVKSRESELRGQIAALESKMTLKERGDMLLLRGALGAAALLLISLGLGLTATGQIVGLAVVGSGASVAGLALYQRPHPKHDLAAEAISKDHPK